MIFGLIFSLFLIANTFGTHAPGVALKINEELLKNINELLTPLIISHYTHKDYMNLNIMKNGPNYELKLNSLSNFIVDPLSATMSAQISSDKLKINIKKLQGYSTFNSEIKIKGQTFSSTGRLILNQINLEFMTNFIQKNQKDNIELQISDIFIEKTNLDPIYTDPAINKTLQEYKDTLKEAYSQAFSGFLQYLINELNTKNIHNLILAYNPICGINGTLIDLPYFDRSNNEIIFFMDGGIIDMKTKNPITVEYPLTFPIENVKNVHKSRFLVSDKIMADLLTGCKYSQIKYIGNKNSIKSTIENIPEILKKYTKNDIFNSSVILGNPMKISINNNEIYTTESNLIYDFYVKVGNNMEKIFSLSILCDYKIKLNNGKHAISFEITKFNIHDVKIINSNISLDPTKIKHECENIFTDIRKEFNDAPLYIDYKEPGVKSYLSYYFTISEIAVVGNYLDIKFLQPEEK